MENREYSTLYGRGDELQHDNDNNMDWMDECINIRDEKLKAQGDYYEND